MNDCRFSQNRQYRYSLTHEWRDLLFSDQRKIVWIGLNPSTADEQDLDPTLRRIRDFSKAWGYGAFTILNLFAYRATFPSDMLMAREPVGPENDQAILEACQDAETIVACWGHLGIAGKRDQAVLELLRNHDIHCLGRNQNGTPKHPLYIKKALELQIFRKTLNPTD